MLFRCNLHAGMSVDYNGDVLFTVFSQLHVDYGSIV